MFIRLTCQLFELTMVAFHWFAQYLLRTSPIANSYTQVDFQTFTPARSLFALTFCDSYWLWTILLKVEPGRVPTTHTGHSPSAKTRQSLTHVNVANLQKNLMAWLTEFPAMGVFHHCVQSKEPRVPLPSPLFPTHQLPYWHSEMLLRHSRPKSEIVT